MPRNNLTKEERIGYLAKPCGCPFCKSRSVSWLKDVPTRKLNSKKLQITYSCNLCNRDFAEVYTLVDVKGCNPQSKW